MGRLLPLQQTIHELSDTGRRRFGPPRCQSSAFFEATCVASTLLYEANYFLTGGYDAICAADVAVRVENGDVPPFL